MNIYNPSMRKANNKIMKQTSDIYLQNNSRQRNSVYHAPNRMRHLYETVKTMGRNSIQIGSQPLKNGSNNLPNPSKPVFKRISHHFRKSNNSQRYQQIQTRDARDLRQMYNKNHNLTTDPRTYSKSPYLRSQQKNNALNHSNQKIRSGNLKQISPYNIYVQPKSSLSQHYDPEMSSHKRRVSLVCDGRYYILDEAKEYYRQNKFQKCIQLLSRYIKTHKSQPEGHYLLGMSLINSNQFSLGIQQLLETIALNPNFKKGLYLVIALVYKRLNQIDQAIQILTKGISIYTDYYDCLVYRGKMFMKKQQYVTAKRDFMTAISCHPNKGFAYVGKGTCEKQMGLNEDAIRTFTDGLKSEMFLLCHEKRARCYFEQEKYELAIKDIQKCEQGSVSSGQYLLRGLIYYKLKKHIEAMLSFEQCLKYDNNRDNITYAIQIMMRIKIQDKDFYEAYHILSRADSMDVSKDIMQEWRLFLEGCLFLMKKKYKDGINNLQCLLDLPNYKRRYKSISDKKIKERFQFLKPLIHLYKAFGQLSENNRSNAKIQYEQHSKVCSQLHVQTNNLSKQYNTMIILAYQHFPKKSLNFIQEASRMICSKPQPYLYLAFDKVQNQLCKQNQLKKQNKLNNQAQLDCQSVDEIIDILSKGISYLPQLSNNHISTFYYYRAIIYFLKNDFNKAVADIDKAIQKSEDNIPKYFNMRGLIFSCFGNFSQGIQDFSVAVNLDEKYAKSYLERAKCLQIEGNSNEAFLDLQKYITLAPEDPYIHKYAGFLLFQNCAYEDCLSAFTHGGELQNDYELMLAKAKAYFLLGDFEQAINLLKKYEHESLSSDYTSDITTIMICKSLTVSTTRQEYNHYTQQLDSILNQKVDQDCRIFKFRDIYQLKASIQFLMSNFKQALQDFQLALKLFQTEKKNQMQKHFIQDAGQFEDEWSQIQIKFNISLCYLCLQMYDKAQHILAQFEKSPQKGKNWDKYLILIDCLQKGSKPSFKKLDVFEQNHRISRYWPLILLPNSSIQLSMAFSYPFVQPPEMMPQFDQSVLSEFHISKIQMKPQAPWINRNANGLIFTPNIQLYDNLELSMTTKNNQQSDQNKPASEMEQSLSIDNSDFQMQTEDLKKKFKLDSLVQIKLQKLIRK